MPKLPRITGEELVKALQKEGFEVARQKGSHVQVRKYIGDEKVTFPVPIHKGKILKLGTLRGILRKAGLSVERLGELLKLELGWKPKVDFEEGLRRYIKWYRSNIKAL